VTDEAVDTAAAPVATSWWRRALVGLWLLVLLGAGVGLALRWDVLISRLAWQPTASQGNGEGVR
jgi:hypothetical protein